MFKFHPLISGSLSPRHGRSQAVDGGTTSNMERSCEYVE